MGPKLELSVLEPLQDLIRISSVNPSLDSEGPGESEIAGFVEAWFGKHGVNAHLDVVAPGRPNVVAEVGSGSGRSLALCAHLDTVGVSDMKIPPFEPTLRDGRVWGRGAYDMKCGAASIMVAMAELARRRVEGRVIAALVVDEEYESAGAQHFVDHYPTDACIVTEPSEGELILAHKGFLWVKISIRGRDAHGSRWDLGVSAISRAAGVIQALTEFDESRLRERRHPLVGPASMHCSLIRGGTGLSTYARECKLHVERRTLPTETADSAFRELRDLVSSVDPDAEIELLLDRPPMTTPADSAIAIATREAVRDVCGSPAKESGVAYWMDAALFAHAGIPTVNYGATGAGAHEAEEWVDLASVERCAEVLVASAERFLVAS